MHRRRATLVLLSGIVAWPATLSAAQASNSPVEEGLRRYLEGKLDPNALRITYSDIHALHGGQELSVRGTGSVEARFVRQKPEAPKEQPRAQVGELVKLLLQIEAWRQLTPDRQPRPDESRARLIIEVGAGSSEIWEWYNDLAANKRLIRVRDHIRRASGLQ